MPYWIINDRKVPFHYYCGQGFRIGVDTTVEAYAASKFETVSTALEVIHTAGNAALYRDGWRIVPAD
jgi:hypothetical protein